jgi:hypothetical protein|eukprot:COSAG01_NODE_5388_length_4291_cov_5.223760_2_plen_65_part_00
MRGLLVFPLETSTHLDKPPRTFFPSVLLNKMATTPVAANNAMSYISRIHMYVTSILTVFRDVQH